VYGARYFNTADEVRDDSLETLPPDESAWIRRELTRRPIPTPLQDPVEWAYLQRADEELIQGAIAMKWWDIPADGRLIPDIPSTISHELLDMLARRFLERVKALRDAGTDPNQIRERLLADDGPWRTPWLLIGTVPGGVAAANTRHVENGYLVILHRGLIVFVDVIVGLYLRARSEGWTAEVTAAFLRAALEAYLVDGQPEHALTLIARSSKRAGEIRRLAVQFVLLHEYAHISYGDADLTDAALRTRRDAYEAEIAQRINAGQVLLSEEELRRFNPTPDEQEEFAADARALELLVLFRRYYTIAAAIGRDPSKRLLFKIQGPSVDSKADFDTLEAASLALLAQAIAYEGLKRIVTPFVEHPEGLLAGYPNPWRRVDRLPDIAHYDAMADDKAIDDVTAGLLAIFGEPLEAVWAQIEQAGRNGLRPNKIHVPAEYAAVGQPVVIDSDPSNWLMRVSDDAILWPLLLSRLTPAHKDRLRGRAEAEACSADPITSHRAGQLLAALEKS
jgi:hypothetical protein